MTQFTPPPLYYASQPPPISPDKAERRILRRQGNFVGALMLANTAGLQLTFTALAYFLLFTGLVSGERLSSAFLGLDKMTYLMVYAGIYTFAMLVPALVVALCAGRRYFPLTPAKRVNGVDAFLVFLACMGLCMLANVVANYVVAFFEQLGASVPETPDLMTYTPAGLLAYIGVFALLPALLEEAVMRGYVLRELRPFGDTTAVLMSALLFGLMHGNLQQVPFAFVVGLALGWIYVKTENIWLAVAVHFGNNALSSVVGYLTHDMDETAMVVFNLIVIGALILLGGAALLLLVLRKSELLRRPSPPATGLSSGRRAGTLLTAPVLLVALAVLVGLAVLEAM